MSVKIGKTISHYRILEEIGSGGMATVYLAYDAQLGVFRAIKILSSELTGRRKVRERFANEAYKNRVVKVQSNLHPVFEKSQTGYKWTAYKDSLTQRFWRIDGEQLTFETPDGKQWFLSNRQSPVAVHDPRTGEWLQYGAEDNMVGEEKQPLNGL